MTTKRISSKINVFLKAMMIFEVIVALISLLFVNKMNKQLVSLNECNNHLTSYYTYIRESNYYIFDYIYSEKDDSIYIEKYNAALEHANELIDNVDSKTRTKLKSLVNMMDFIHKPISYYDEGLLNQYETYHEILTRSNLVTSTNEKYYEILSDYYNEQNTIIQNTWQIFKVMLLSTFVVSIVFLLVYGIRFSKDITEPINEMVNKTQDIKNEKYKTDAVKTNITEYNELDSAINDMSKQIEHNVETIKRNSILERQLLEQKNSNLSMQNMVIEANLRQLQSQINPHFLFNTLNMISDTAYLNDDEETTELIEKLMSFLRYALDKSNSISSLYEEIESIDDYIYIQRKRFGNRIDFIVDNSKKVGNIRMPALILQPLIENCILHGVNEMINGAEISIKVREDKGNVLVKIEDNGKGMSSDQLEKLQLRLFSEQEIENDGQDGNSIGLRNIYRRLKAFYGEKMNFIIDSNENCGTLITIKMPKELKNGEV